MEKVARFGIRARPYGDRKHHDVARGKSGDRKRPHEFPQNTVFPSTREIVEVGVETRLVQCRDEGWRCIAPPDDRDAPGRQIDPRPLDLRQAAQDALDPGDARAAMDRRHAELVLPQAGPQGTARQQQFVAMSGSSG